MQLKVSQVSNLEEVRVRQMLSRIRLMLVVVGLALIALVGLNHVSQQSRNAVHTAASAVWGS